MRSLCKLAEFEADWWLLSGGRCSLICVPIKSVYHSMFLTTREEERGLSVVTCTPLCVQRRESDIRMRGRILERRGRSRGQLVWMTLYKYFFESVFTVVVGQEQGSTNCFL